MTVLCVGANHSIAPLALVERMAFTDDDAAALLWRVAAGAPSDVASDCGAGDRPLPFRELLVFSTRYRAELYAVPSDDILDTAPLLDLLGALLAARSGDPAHSGSHLLRLSGVDAERHLCRVAAGLESFARGESEIRARLSDALSLAVRCGAAGPVLTALGGVALRVAKRAPSETGIGADAMSVCSVAAERAEELADELRGRRALIIGGGELAAGAATALRARGYWDMVVVSVDADAAAALAAATCGKTVPAESIAGALAESDLVVGGADAAVPAIDAALVRTAMRGRMARPLAFIDLATPSAIDPAVRDLAGVRVVDMEELRERLELAVARRHRELPVVEAIVEEELRTLHAPSDGAALVAIMRELRDHAEEIRRREVERALERIPDASPEVRAQVEWLSVSLTTKLLDAPTRRLRRELANGDAESYAGVTRALFGLADAPPALGA